MEKVFYAAKGVIRKEDKVLILHKSDVENDVWELPGGRMRFGETAGQTLIREVKEETGFDIEIQRLLDTWDFIKGDLHITGVVFICDITGGEFRISSEHDKYKWAVPDKEMVRIVDEPFKHVLEKLVKDEYREDG